MAYENNDKRQESVYSSRVKAGKRRTYFFDVRATRANDYFLTITESRKRFDDDGYDRSKLFLYKEDFNKFIKGLIEAVEYVKTDLMPDFNFDAFNHENGEYEPNNQQVGLPDEHTGHSHYRSHYGCYRTGKSRGTGSRNISHCSTHYYIRNCSSTSHYGNSGYYPCPCSNRRGR